jgi:RNA polymerase sigma factor (sigma-70 family)
MNDTGKVLGDDLGPDFARALREARGGDQAAWGILFNECYPRLLRVVDRRLDNSLRSRYDSADFASEAMKSLVARFDRLHFDSIEALLAFLIHVAKQKIIEEYRRVHVTNRHIRRGRRPFAQGADSWARGPCSSDPGPIQLAEANEVQERLWSLFDEGARIAVLLKQQGYSTSDIARRLGWGVRKVQRVLHGLRDSIEDPGCRG